MAESNKLVTIPGELHSAATGNIVAASKEIFDYDASAYQVALNKTIYNVSRNNANAKYDLAGAIAAVPQKFKDNGGGLIITFINQSNDSYESYQCDSSVFTSDVSKWSYVKKTYIIDNPEWSNVVLDASGHVIAGIKTDGSIEWSVGVPTPVKEYVEKRVGDVVDVIVPIIDSSIKGLEMKVDSMIDSSIGVINSEIDKRFYNITDHTPDASTLVAAIESVPEDYKKPGLIITFLNEDGDYDVYQCDSSVFSTDIENWKYFENAILIDNPEWAEVKLDKDNKIVQGIDVEGNTHICGSAFIGDNLNVSGDAKVVGKMDIAGVTYTIIENPEWSTVWLDADGKIVFGIKINGDVEWGSGVPTPVKEYIDKNIAHEINKKIYSLVDDGNNYTLAEAIAAVPDEYKNGGLILTYKTNESDIESYQLNKSYWSENQEDWFNLTNTYVIDNPEYIQATIDSSNKVISAITKDGQAIICGVNVNELQRTIENNTLAIEYDSSTYGIYSITGINSEIDVTMDDEGHIFMKQTID